MSGKKKCFLTVMLVVGMESLLSGCGTGTSVNDTVAQTNDSLTIYVLDIDQSLFVDPPVAEYKKRYPDVEVEIKTIPAEDLENQQKQIAAELMAGDGADLYVKMEPYRLLFAGYGYDISDGMKNAEILNSSVFQRDMEYYKKQAYPEGTYVGEQSWEAYEADFVKLLHEQKPYLG